jgi:hypothetical protein
MNEAFLSYLWKFRQLNQDIRTESGESLAILHPGDLNTNSGPDFFNARIRIGPTTWAGNVEIHVLASDWFRHGHHCDPAYDHTILHVVYEDDRKVFHQNGEPIQTLVVKNQFPVGIFDRYQLMMLNKQWIPCMNQLHATEDYGFSMWAPGLAVERMEYKANGIRHFLTSCGNDWEEALYRHVATSFGFKINSMPFELLAKSLPLKVIRHHQHQLFQLEALLFGQAGMLDKEFKDQYPGELRQEYHFLRDKYGLQPVCGSLWKFLRLRPGNFPTIRISQFASFIFSMKAGFFSLLEGGTLDRAIDKTAVAASEYWFTHYVFDKPSAFSPKCMGNACVQLLIINGLAPFLFFYGHEKGQPQVCEDVLNSLEQIDGERNLHMENWKRVGFPVDNAMQTQALLYLKQFYCDNRRCLECRIGTRLLTDKGL